LAFTSLALVATFFLKDLSGNMTDKVAVTLSNDKPHDEKNRAAEA
jgi:hypothetical protein